MSSVIGNTDFVFRQVAGQPWQSNLSAWCYSLLETKVETWDIQELARQIYLRSTMWGSGKNTCGLCCFPMIPRTVDGYTVYVIGDQPNIPKKLLLGGKTIYDHLFDAIRSEGLSFNDIDQFLMTLSSLTDGDLQTKKTLEEQEAFKEHICSVYAKNPIEPRTENAYFTATTGDIIELCWPHIEHQVGQCWHDISTIKATKGTPPLQEVLVDLAEMEKASEPEPEDIPTDVVKRLEIIGNKHLDAQIKIHISKCVAHVQKVISIEEHVVADDKIKDLKGMTPEIAQWFTEFGVFAEPEGECEPEGEAIVVDECIEFRCPILLDTMSDPVIASDGFSYERSAIESYISFCVNQKHILRSPMTREVITNALTPNRVLRSLINDWKTTD